MGWGWWWEVGVGLRKSKNAQGVVWGKSLGFTGFFWGWQNSARFMLSQGTMKQAIFLERDGILNLVLAGRPLRWTPPTLAEFRVNEEAAPLLERLRAVGFRLIATTNQPGLSDGRVARREVDRMHELLRARLPLDDILVCPHGEGEGCPCQKPRPGLFTEAAFKWQLNLERCFVVSDKWQDAAAARMAGCTSLLIRSPAMSVVHYDIALPNLEVIVERILKMHAFGQVLAA